ncbi:MAG TPA: tetratricopeptide repeat protein [Gemmatimonadaceae bacterium]|nr:tetratricopeptide repeat protein [Gemmatimonadaceae bacterium]
MNRRTWWLLALLIAVLALAASVTSLRNGFAYDDVYLIARSPRMHTLAGWWREFAHTYWPEDAGGDGYRPLTIIAFRAEWALGTGNPFVFHAVNVVLHAITSVVVLWLATAMMPVGAAAVAGAVYAVHPVHVEAVANVVGQSELWVALLISLAMAVFVHGRRAGALTPPRWAAIAALYAAGLLFKEHAIVLPALLLLAEATVVPDRAPVLQRIGRLRLAVLGLTVVALLYLWARSVVVVGGFSGFQPYIVFQALSLSAGDRVLTMIGAAPEWLRLFLWPARLMTEYAPPYIDIAQGASITQLPGLLVLVGILGLLVACWRRSPVTSFGIGWLVITLLPASNFLIPAGFIIAERTLLLPSVGVVIAIASAVPWLYARAERRRLTEYVAAGALALVLALGVWRSATRNPVWKDNETLFRQAIKDSPESYRAHFMLGVMLFEELRKTEGEGHYRTALRMFPYDPLMAFALAEQYRKAGMCEPAITLYRWLYTIEPNSDRGHLGFASCLLTALHLDEAKAEALRAIRGGGRLASARELIRAADMARDSLAARRARVDSASIMPASTPVPR